MKGLERARKPWVWVLCLLALAGCGSDAGVGVGISSPSRQTVSSVQGFVRAPNGEFAAAGNWRSWVERLSFVAPAYAALEDTLLPVTTIQRVSLVRVDPADAAHGSSADAQLLAQADTDSSGLFNIVYAPLDQLDTQCGLMVEVGGGALLTRAFVLQHSSNDLDAVSEAVVHVVLDRLAQVSGLHLCDLSIAELIDISNKAAIAASGLTGDTVAAVNQNAYALVSADPSVQAAIDAALPQ